MEMAAPMDIAGRARQLADALPDAVIAVDADGRVCHWGAGAGAIYGYRADEAIGQAIAALTLPADHVEQFTQLLSAARSGGIATQESVRRRKDGSLLYVDVTCKTLPADGEDAAQMLISEKDVTPIKVRRDAKLMDARFRDLLESTPDGIVMVNPTGHIIIANAEAERLFGYAPGELLGLSVDALLPQRFRDAHITHRFNYFLQPRKRAMGSGLDLSGLRKDGSEFPIEISLSPLRTEEASFVMSAIRDISERKRFEQALKEKNLELAEANRAKDHFLASMSHELRTPLNAIIGFTGTLLMRLPGPLTDDQEKHLRTVQSSGRHLLSLINDLLDIAKIEAGQAALDVEPVDLAQLLEEVASTLAPQAQGKGLALSVSPSAGPVVVTLDRRAVQQIVINLVGNAIKFTEHGRVQLMLRRVHDPVRPRVEVDVSDTGIGIPGDEQSKLFGAFARIRPRQGSAQESTGLGLHLSQKLAHLLGGEIRFRSEAGRGSTFTLSLPGA